MADFGKLSTRIARPMDTVGDGSGTISAAVDGSVTPVRFRITAGPGQRINLGRLLIYVEDGGQWSADNYADFPGPLTNGIFFRIYDALTDEPISQNPYPQLVIRKNADWYQLTYQVAYTNFGSGSDFLSINYAFYDDNDQHRGLILNENQYFAAIVQDDLTNLVEQTFLIRGNFF